MEFDPDWDPCYEFVRYSTFQWEQCPRTGRIHVQGFIQLKKQLRISSIKQGVFNDLNPHLEKRFGSVKDCIAYCQKDDTRFAFGKSHGEPTHQGERTDIQDFTSAIAKHSDSEMIDLHPSELARYIKYYHFVKEVRSREKAQRFRTLQVMIYWGEPGTGKTRAVYDAENYADVFPVTAVKKGVIWFNGYDNQDCLLFDDFYGGVALSFLLRLLDGYPLLLETKGGHIWANYSYVYFTSNVHYENWYAKAFTEHPKLLRAFERRLTIVKKF